MENWFALGFTDEQLEAMSSSKTFITECEGEYIDYSILNIILFNQHKITLLIFL